MHVGPPTSPGMINLNKRFIRIATTIVTFFFMVGVFVRRESDGSQLLSIPVLGSRAKAYSSSETYDFSTTSSFFPVSMDPAGKSVDELCASFPKHLLNHVQPILKMGYGEDRAKVDAQLETVSTCFGRDDLLIFSDLDESVRGHNVIDILADLPAPYFNLTANPDMQHYIWQRAMRANGTLGDKEEAKKINGWILDKYKFLPMIERAWMTKPNKPFYFFYETDTYVFWDNLFRFLQTFDPDVPLYMGSPSPGRANPRSKKQEATWFANGGPGFVLSRAAVKALLKREVGPTGQYAEPSLAEKWLDLLQMECCGDSVIGYTLFDVNIHLQGYWPMFNPHPLHGVPFSDAYWCQPVLTLHKTMAHEMTDLWKWEFTERHHDTLFVLVAVFANTDHFQQPLLYADLWGFHHTGQKPKLENWDNGDWDRWDVPDDITITSAAQCEKYCKSDERCLQWNWRGEDENRCIPMGSIRQGRERKLEELPAPEPETDSNGELVIPTTKPKVKHVDFTAGWMQTRIREWTEQHQCDKPQWVGPSTTRIF
ncbi:hypothetical protein HJFPF1_12681 [Paramyrothecium foliicola]|nr:hypothetical protein HJFPF1_12681 [Paramyrothecium foliicola]